VGDERLFFGVSGKIYNHNMLLYDKKTETLWSQLKGEAIAGPMTGKKLRVVPAENTTWAAWYRRYPKTQVMSFETGHDFKYDANPYIGFRYSDEFYFPLEHQDKRLEQKKWVFGVVVNGKPKAYPLERLLLAEAKTFTERIGNEAITIVFDPESKSALFYHHENKIIPSVRVYWFAWAAFHPDTLIYQKRREWE